MREIEIIIKMMNMYIFSWGWNLQESKDGRGYVVRLLVGRYMGCNYLLSLYFVIFFYRLHQEVVKN